MTKETIIQVLKKETGLKNPELERPKDILHGDFAFPCFALAKTQKKSPVIIAKELAAALVDIAGVEKVEALGPYLNFYLERGSFTEEVLSAIRKQGSAYGRGEDRKKTYMLEFFHANTHKGVHIGHIRNISLGEALSRIYTHAGFRVIRVNYQGDIGPHVTKCLWGYLHLEKYKGKEPADHRGVWLGRIYAEANGIISANKELENEVREMTKRLYDGDPELVSVWKKTRQWCLDDFAKMYEDFHVHYDRLYFESEVEQAGKRIVQDMLKKGIAKMSDGATIMDLEDDHLGVYVLLRNDGVALYHTKDLALAELKSKEFQVDKSFHIVGKEQELYFKQLFRTFELIGSPMAGKSFHVIYALVMLPEGKMSSREGNVVWYDELIEKLLALADEEIRKRHQDWKEDKVKKTATFIAYGALKFAMVNRDNSKAMVFDWDKAMDFEGETGPYVQYAYARIQSIFRKHGAKVPEQAKVHLLTTDLERRIINHLSVFPDAVTRAARTKKPILVARYLLDLAQLWNEYYHASPILKAEDDLRDARLSLIEAIGTVIEVGMDLLAIDLPPQM
ncbi:MAG: arginine--tRNA ligase [DPANN group archaeon]|nr:arginine--tRNA ligase [DPANN group archaeon]